MRFDILLAITMQSTTIMNVTPCSLVKVYQYFRTTYCFHLLGKKYNGASKEAASRAALKMEALYFSRLHGFTSQNTISFIIILFCPFKAK
jgi:hypothetical protein